MIQTKPQTSPPKLDMKWFTDKVLIPVSVAVIALAASIWAARITATSTATSTATTTAKETATTAANRAIYEEQQRMSGGTISSSGTIINRIGRTYTVSKQ